MRGIRLWRVTAVCAAVLVTVTAGAAGLDWRGLAGLDRSGTPGESQMARIAEAPDQGSAVRAALAQGSRVEAVDLRTETRTVYAQPDGTMLAELTAQPVRAKRADGTWAPVDTTLVRRPDGTVGPRAAVVDLAFSGGGATTPLVRYGRQGSWLALSWPGRLPAPALSGNTATYAEVLPGVDLRLTAEADGYAQYLVVKDRKAAANPAVRTVRLGLRTGGLSVRAARDGRLEARNAKGAVLYTAPVSRMWDAGAPRREATVGVAVEKSALVLRPDAALLSGQSTQYPVTVDPVWHTADKHRWTSVLEGKPGTPYPNTSGEYPWAQVGQCYVPSGICNGIGLAHTYWMFDTSFLADRLVISADLQLVVVHSPSCDDRIHQVWKANADIHDGTSWSNKPGGIAGTTINFTAPRVHNCQPEGPGSKGVGIGVAGLVNRGGTTTFLVQPADRSDQLAWRRYENNAKLSVVFNRIPDVPTGLQTDPPLTACRWCNGVPYVADDNVRLMATLTDPDSDQTQSVWQVKVNGAVYSWESGFQNNGAIHSYDVSTVNRHNMAVEWAVKAEDTAQHGGGWAQGTTFVIDKQPPASAPVVGATPYLADNRWHGGVGVPGRFVFTRSDEDIRNGVDADIDHYLWGWTQDPTNKVVASALGGYASVTLTPPGDGPRDLFVRAVDRAGHRGPVTQHHFYVRAGNGPLAQWSLDGNAEDEAFLGDRDGVVQGGVTYTTGAVDQAARLDGTTGYVTAPYTVRTDASFSVSAWAKLDSAGAARAVVSQSGANFPGFVLWYRPDNGGRWVFGMPKSTATYQGTDLAVSAQPAQVGVWTHLTGVYDAGERKLRLYVDGVPAGTVNRTAADWALDGRVQIGRTMWEGNPGTDYWPGLLDEVKIYDRMLSAEEVRAAVGADNVQVGHWKFDELSGTTGRNDVLGGEMVALRGNAAFTGDSNGDNLADGGVVGGGLKLDGNGDDAVTAGPAVHTNQSFTVAGWVQLEQAPGSGLFLSALSQDGANISGFFLGYRQRASGGGVWEFTTPGSDASGAPSGGAGVQSTSEASLNTPTHLAAVYDVDARQLRLYVNGRLEASGTRLDGFDATGPLAIGRGFNGGPGGYWKGLIDEVRAYSRALSTAEVEAIVSRDDVALGEWRLDGNAEGVGGTGTLVGTPTWTTGQSDAPDPTDLALQLSGDDHIGLPRSVDVRQSFSVSAWAKLDQVGGTATVVSQDGPASSVLALLAIPDGRWSFAMSATGAAGGAVDRVDGPAAQVGVWTHLVGIYDAGADQLSLYVNGVPGGAAKPHLQSLNPAGKLQIGAGQSGSTRQNRLIGAIDDVAVYGRVLFAAEIREMAGRDLTLAHNWRLDEGAGPQSPDAVGRHSATLVGGVTRVPGRLGNAVELDGKDGRLATGGVDIRTDVNFTVAAWVRLKATCPLTPDLFECKATAVSLDGAAGGTSKFRLGHWRDRNQFSEGVWVFEMPEADGMITKAAVPIVPSDLEAWVHLAGVYDKATGKLWLYVNGTRKGDGTLNVPWNTEGGLQIGRGVDPTGNPSQYLNGQVDDVRLYSGRLDDDRISNLYGSYPVQCGTVLNPIVCKLPTPDKGRWQLDENTGTTAADSSGRGLTATLGGGTSRTGGRIGRAVQFDGTSGYAKTAGPVLATSGSFSVSAWVAAGATTPAGNQIVLAQSGSQASAFYLYRDPGGRWGAAISGGDTAAPALTTVLSTERVWPGQWTHLGLVYNDTLHQLRLYVNGRLSAAYTGASTWETDATGPFSIAQGRWGGADGAFFQGTVDDVRAFGDPLRDGEMRKVYDDTSAVMLGNWNFDAQTVADSSWRNNPTTTTGPISYVDGVVGKALVLDGQTSAATGQHPAVLPITSLTVSAWAKLTREPAVQTVVAQDGTRMSGFALQYRPELDTWVFGAWTQDADRAEFIYAKARGAAVLGEWTHLTGVYDHAAGELRVYVNGQLVGDLSGVTLWPATGGLSIGRGKVYGAPDQYFTGQIDEVRTDLGVVPDTEIAQRATRA